jgi:hypothetical protein
MSWVGNEACEKHLKSQEMKIPISLRQRQTRLPVNLPTVNRAENGIRTRDPQLGKLMLCQLSYFRTVRYGGPYR